MANGSLGSVQPVENPATRPGSRDANPARSYSQTLHSGAPGREAPRSLPFSEDGEKGVMCSLLLSPREIADQCVLRLHRDAFYLPAHQIVYELVLEFNDKGKPVDFVTLKQMLKDRGQLEEIGGPEYLDELYSFVPTAANASYYIEIVREKYVLR